MTDVKFLICRKCGNLVEVIQDAGVPMMCCGQKMEALEPNTVDASGEKHLPVVKQKDGALEVCVGTVEHPMEKEHSIEWVCVKTENGCQRKGLSHDSAPSVTFSLGDEKAKAVYAYCNLHGLWMTKL